ncbi:MAG: D-alanyl-D-alanine carboxypeptidase [Lachnospiraceae bacterium]|nr:D-alanyl-D-alanine carboxypeptidase [Lachnospiraceae bacterium]
MKRIVCVILPLLLLLSAFPLSADPSPEETLPFNVDARSAVLMEASTGTILYDMNGEAAYPPASVTKVMTLLLVMEAIDSGRVPLDGKIQISQNAASMGGSQVYLEPGEIMTVEDLLKSVVVSSANDAAVALAEAVCGSEETFVSMMNEKAASLGMNATHFENPTGLDDTVTNHVTSARDIAIMSRELIVKHPDILKYSSIWMDTIRDGAFGLSNTNRLIRYYQGANGLKTGSTGKAKYCISATAKRDGMQLIAVIMGSETRDIRNEAAKKLLDYGFSNYRIVSVEPGTFGPVPVTGGTADNVGLFYEGCSFLVPKSGNAVPEIVPSFPETLEAPILKGQTVGKAAILLSGQEIGTVDIRASDDVPRITFPEFFRRVLCKFLFG